MRLSNAIIVAPGGIGTLLELYYAWQLIQVGHIKERPIILVGNMWRGLIDWMKENQLNNKLIDKKDIDQIQIVDQMEEVVPILQNKIEAFYKE